MPVGFRVEGPGLGGLGSRLNVCGAEGLGFRVPGLVV